MTPVRVPFSVFEELLSLGNLPEAPLTIQTEYRFEGTLDEARLREAVARAVAIHPMARARQVAPRRGLRPPQWEIGPADTSAIVRSISCSDDAELAGIRNTFYSTMIGVAEAPALRLLIAHRPGGDSLLLSIDHLITDGVGSLRFLHSVARAYCDRPDPVPDVDPVAARALRVEFGRETAPQARKAGRPRNPKGKPTFVHPQGTPDAPGYGILHLSLSDTDRRRLDARRFGPSATNNDLLLAAFHQTIAQWNEQHGQPAGLIAVLMPVNFRPLDWYSEVVGNLTLGGRVITLPEQRATPEALMAAVLNRTQWLKTGGGGLALSFNLPSWLYGLIPLLLRAISRLAGDLRLSGVLSYFGKMDGYLPDFGPEAGAVTEAWGSPPTAMPTGIAIGAGIVRGRLLIALRHCRALLDDDAARRFGERLVTNLLALGTGTSDVGSSHG